MINNLKCLKSKKYSRDEKVFKQEFVKVFKIVNTKALKQKLEFSTEKFNKNIFFKKTFSSENF